MARAKKVNPTPVEKAPAANDPVDLTEPAPAPPARVNDAATNQGVRAIIDCVKCAYWKRKNAIEGECRANPPMPSAMQAHIVQQAVWPITREEGGGCAQGKLV